MKDLKETVEKIFEKYNVKIQIIICLASLIIGAYFDINQKNELGIVIGLLTLITGELITLSIKDSITQRKLDSMGVRVEMLRGGLFRVHDFNLTTFFKNTRSQFFISGMALNGFFHNNKAKIQEFLDEGKEVFVLIADPDAVIENAKLYHGTNLNENEFSNRVASIYAMQRITLDHINEIQNIYRYMQDGKFQLRILKSVFSTSFVAYDIFKDDLAKHNRERKEKELKASFYQYRCTDPSNEPNIIVDSFLSRDWYLFFRKIIMMQWDDATPISNEQEFEEFRNKVIELEDRTRKMASKTKEDLQ